MLCLYDYTWLTPYLPARSQREVTNAWNMWKSKALAYPLDFKRLGQIPSVKNVFKTRLEKTGETQKKKQWTRKHHMASLKDVF